MADTNVASDSPSLKDAVLAAKAFFLDLKDSGLLGGPGIRDVVLEEVDRTPEGDWLITLGYRQPSQLDDIQGGLAALRPQRSEFFKRFRVNQGGHVIAMNLREPVRG